MAKRIGLKRTQALLEGLKRELNMDGSTWGGKTSTAGSGLQSGSIAAPVTRVSNIGGDIVTTIQLDLQDLSGSSTSGECIGNAEAAAAGSSPAFLYEHSDTVNGILYKIDISCLELPAGGAANKDFDIEGATTGLFEHGDDPDDDPYTAYTMGGNIAKGQTIVDTTVSSGDGDFFYLTTGAAGAATAAKFTAGKLVIRFYGRPDF
jgi:hypothetical protein